MTIYKAVIQLSASNTKTQKSLITQLNNIKNAIEHIEIEVVVHGDGLTLLYLENKYNEQLKKLHEQDVHFLVCQNTLLAKQITTESLLPFCNVIPSALAHIIVRQSEGWSYIKAG